MNLSKYPVRALNSIASTFGQCDVRVLLTDQLKFPTCIAIGPRTVALDPSLAGIGELLIAAIIISQQRQKVRESSTRKKLIRSELRAWIQQATQQLATMFPGSAKYFSQKLPVMRVEWDQIRFAACRPSDIVNGVAISLSNGVQFVGAKFIETLLMELAAGKYPTEKWEGLDMPVARIPQDLGVPNAHPREIESLEAIVKDAIRKTSSFSTCFVRKSIGKLQSELQFDHARTGTSIDSRRLTRAVIDVTSGNQSARLYKVRSDQRDRIFNPDEHHVVQAIDLGSLKTYQHPYSGYSPDLVAIVAESFRNLEVGHSIILFADQILELNGNKYYLHCPIKIKAYEESLRGVAFERLALLASLRLSKMVNISNAQFACYQPIQIDSAFREMQRVERKIQHGYQTLLYINTRSLPIMDDEYQDDDYFVRVAEVLEDKLKEISKQSNESRIFDLDFLFLDARFKSAAKKGTRVAKSISLMT